MKYSQAQLKQIINEEIQNEIQSLDEGLGDILQEQKNKIVINITSNKEK